MCGVSNTRRSAVKKVLVTIVTTCVSLVVITGMPSLSAAEQGKTSVPVQNRRIASSIYEMRLDPGLSHYWLTVHTGGCYASTPVTVGKNSTRHLVSVPGPFEVFAYHGESWLFGRVPPGIGVIMLRDPQSGHPMSDGFIDDGYYYFELLPPGQYRLSFEAAGRTFELPVKVIRGGTEVDIGVKVLRNLLPPGQ